MNKTLTYTLAAIIVIVVIAAIAFNINHGNDSSGGDSMPSGESMSLRDLIGKNNQQCTFSTEEGGVEASGTVYVASGMIRGDFMTTTADGQVIESHMIADGETANVWTNQTTQGITLNFGVLDETADPGQNQGFVDPDEKVEYDCGRWTPDQSVFELPSGVQFMSMEAMMDAMMQGSAGQ